MDSKINELLKEVRINDKESKLVEKAVSFVKDVISKIPDQEVVSDAALGFVRDLSFKPEKVRLSFRTPESVDVVGSYSLQAIVKPEIKVDIFVRMPKECFHEKDYLNHKYHAKRCLYLCAIKKHLDSLKSESSIRKIEWSTFNNEARKPVLIIYPGVEIPESSFFIRIFPTVSSNLFKLSMLTLSRNNLTQGGESENRATPKYNSSILEDMFLEENFEFIKKAFHQFPKLVEALILLKVWVRQRSSINMHDCMNGYLLSIMLAFLAKSGGNIVNNNMSCHQIFRKMMMFIGTSKAWEKGVSLQPAEQRNLSKEDLNQYLEKFPAVLFDVSGNLNLTFRIRKAAFVELKDEAQYTLNCLNKFKDDSFFEIFMTKLDFASKFDLCLRINMTKSPKISELAFYKDEDKWSHLENELQSTLEKGLTDRSKSVRTIWPSSPSNWNITDGFAKFGEEPMIVTIQLSTYKDGFRMIDVGPSLENKKEADDFVAFWGKGLDVKEFKHGKKSELTHFKDGRTVECAHWECLPSERHDIVRRIVQHLVNVHFGVVTDDVFCSVDQLDFCLRVNGKDPIVYSEKFRGAFEKLSKKLRGEFEELSKKLKSIDEDVKGMPFEIKNIQPLHSAFRNACVYPPSPHPLLMRECRNDVSLRCFSCVQSMDVAIEIGGSFVWPLDPIAIEKTKQTLLIKIADSLEKKKHVISCTASEQEVHVQISGYSFSLKILRHSANEKNNNARNIDNELFIKSQHSSMINGLDGRFPIYSPVVRLAKKWISSHLFSSYISEEAIELIVAYIFLNPFPFTAPLSRISGFLRFLRLLANYNWTLSPLIVDINNDFTSKDKEEINKNYEDNKNKMEGAMYIATTYDKTSQAWTNNSPCKLVVKRLIAYAQSSADLLSRLIINDAPSPYTWECLFRTPLNNYDAVVLLHRNQLSRPHYLRSVSSVPEGKFVTSGEPCSDFDPYLSLGEGKLSWEDAKDNLLVNFNPVNYFLRDIKTAFPDTLMTWHDSIGGDAIGLTWRKNISKKRGRDEVEEREIDEIKILKEIGEIGEGLVKSVHLLKKPKLESNKSVGKLKQ